MDNNEKFWLVQRAYEGKILFYTMIAESGEQAIALTKYDLAFLAENMGRDDKSIWENMYWATELQFCHGATYIPGLNFNQEA